KVSLFELGQPKVELNARKLGVHGDSPAIGGSRFLELLFLGKDDSQASEGDGVARIFLQPRAPFAFRLLQLTLLLQCDRRLRTDSLRTHTDSRRHLQDQTNQEVPSRILTEVRAHRFYED